ncbi:energy-coupling factor transport system ATP-binding protein [Croceifilum oryzae]|uniref:Energy-coupling factor transport system ATP-binding protein n=1 Tax=Croceifilum oryzae TaxID=1553429 RepID=A0AAJ1TI63_9BACL|nr:ABC transporter ATP-binding protein [Croceifilum oryzae]MDQ0416419.1 energy-coupling factor transport system ATP-binding protein [Croceifilum oryzae]
MYDHSMIKGGYGVHKLRLKFPGDESLLFRDCDFQYQKGEKILFLGPSGCGKSTLLQVLAGLIPHAIDVPMKAQQVVVPESTAVVFQDPDTQFCMTHVDEEIAFVLENLQIPREEMPDQIKKYVSVVGLDLEDVHTSIHTLSGGMKQRLAIASAMALQPEVLFLDEPTAFLDTDGTKQVWETIRQLPDDQTLLIVEHKIEEMMDVVDRIVLFRPDGTILADGKKEEVLANYQEQLREYGIWYPGIWEERLIYRSNDSVTSQADSPLLALRDFQVLHSGDVKLQVSHADLYQGEWIAVIGKNGAGKSTLLQGIRQLLKTKGKLLYQGSPIARADLQKIGFVFQNPELQFVASTVGDEVAYTIRQALKDPTEEEIHQMVQERLEMFSLWEHRHKHPYQLSVGQKRRLSVCATIHENHQILLLDEPTFGLDAQNTFSLLNWLEELRQSGTTIVMVTHSEEIARYYADRIWWIGKGHLQKVSSNGVSGKELEDGGNCERDVASSSKP